MKEALKYIPSLIIIGLITYLLFKSNTRDEVTYDYETRIKEINREYYGVLEDLKNTIRKLDTAKPHIIKEYIKETPTYVINNYVDSTFIVIDTILRDTIYINTDFVKLYPTSHKLINFTLDGDSLNLVTLDLNGKINDNLWPIDTQNYDYFYIDNQLRYKSVNRKTVGINRWNNLYLNAGYEFVYNDPYAGLSYTVPFGNRLGITASMTTIFSDKPITLATVGLGYRLLK